MNGKHLFNVALLLTAFVWASCSSDDATSSEEGKKTIDTKGLTEFAMVKPAVDGKAARKTLTAGEYTGSSIKFYWTSGDHLWINHASLSPALKVSATSDIPAANGKVETAKFYFDGIYGNDSYPVRYTGSSTVGDKVTIKVAQAQATPNDGSHIGTDGDCGTAVATKDASGVYTFNLNHKASYLTFTPYYTTSGGFDASVKVTKIKVTADKAIAGTYEFSEAGLHTSTPPANASNCITLTLGTGGFPIPSASSTNYTENAAIMVLAPGTYTNFTVEYTLKDFLTGTEGTYSKTYPSVTLNEGRNRRINENLGIINRGDKLYMWDALKDYWFGYENEQPALNGVVGPHYPKSKLTDSQRWFYDVQASTGTATGAGAGARICPNVNEMLWYVFKGKPHWDGNKLFSFAKHLYKGGMWFKKKSVIMAENGLNSATMRDGFEGVDYRPVGTGWARINSNVVPNAPANTGDYFFLPAINFFWQGSFYGSGNLGTYGDYWTSTASNQNNSNLNAFNLAFHSNRAGVHSSLREKGAMTIAFE